MTPADTYDPRMVESYTDYRLYMDAALRQMNSTRGALADNLGISRAMVTHIMRFNRKLNPTLVPQIAAYFSLNGMGRNLLGAMVDLDNDSARARRSAWATLQAHQRFLMAERPDARTLQVLSTWWICAIYELAAIPSFNPDPRWIAETMVPRIDEDQAQEGLQALLAAGMLVPDGRGGLSAVQDLQWTDTMVPEGEQSAAVWKLQKGLFDLAKEAPARFSGKERHQSGAVIAIPPSRYQAVVNRLRELEREVFHLATSPAEDAPDRVFAMSVQLFPLTEARPNERDGSINGSAETVAAPGPDSASSPPPPRKA